jgi:predicted MFS family arabinose efflux permease
LSAHGSELSRTAGSHRALTSWPRGAVFNFAFFPLGIRPLGSLFGGALGSTIGVRPTLWIATVGATAGLLWLLPSPVPGLKEPPDEPEASG